MFEGAHRSGGLVFDVPCLEPGPPAGAGHPIDALSGLQRLRSWIDQQEQVVLAQLAADPGSSPQWLAKNLAAAEVACALRVAEPVAQAKLHTATELVTRFPGTLDALGAGAITMAHARILTEAAADLDDKTATELEAAVLPRAAKQGATAFRRSVARARARLAPRQAEDRHADAVADRDVHARALPDGMGELNTVISAEDMAAVMDVLTAEAHRKIAAGDERSIGQLRADTLVDRILGRTDTNPNATGGASVHVTLAFSTLTGRDEQPGELAGYGPIPASMARRLAAQPDSIWRRLVTDDLGRLLDYGRSTYRPPAGLADFVRAYDQTCRFPGCHRPARTCELDHATAWNENGHTNFTNLITECPRHHHVKHDANWSVKRLPDGTVRWTSPTGHEYDRPPDPLPTDRTVELLSTDPDPPPF